MSELIAQIQTFAATPTGVSLLAMAATWFAGNGVRWLLAWGPTQKILAAGLLTAKAPALALAKLATVPPVKYLIGPLVCLLIFAGFWLFTFMDTLLGSLAPDVRQMADSLERMLSKMGATDRQLYIMAKGMKPAEVEAVSKMAEAVKAPPAVLDEVQKAAVGLAVAVGNDLQAARLAEPVTPARERASNGA